MTKNLIPIIAENLGVEIGEEFAFETNVIDELVCRFTDKELQMKKHTEEWVKAPISLNYFCQQKIIKLPFRPHKGEKFWTYDMNWRICEWTWLDNFEDYCRKAMGCVFRTKEEAIATRPAKYRELTGKEWKENG